MQYTLMLWHADHLNFGRLLNFLEGELARLRNGDSPNYQLVLDIMYYMTHYSDVVHHPKEDLVFARIKIRDASIGPTIDKLIAEHAQLRDIGEAMVRELNGVVDGSMAPRERVEATAQAYISGLRAHMRTEEIVILPLAAALLSEGDWADIDATIASFADPLFGTEVQDRYAGLREQINRQVQADRAIAS